MIRQRKCGSLDIGFVEWREPQEARGGNCRDYCQSIVNPRLRSRPASTHALPPFSLPPSALGAHGPLRPLESPSARSASKHHYSQPNTFNYYNIYRLGPLLLGSSFNAFLLGFVLIEGRAYFRSQNKCDILRVFSCAKLIPPLCVRDRQWLKLLVRIKHSSSLLSSRARSPWI